MARVATEAGRHRAVRSWPWYGFGIANFLVLSALALVFWYLLADPVISPLKIYPMPFNLGLFWAILAAVFLGFNLEGFGFGRLPQPVRGLALMVATVLLALAIAYALVGLWGRLDPDFSAGRPGYLGYLTAALPVLFGFFTYVTVVINWGHWPWAQLGLKQPWVGIGDILLMTPLTLLAYALLALPSLAVWARPGAYLLDLNTTIGWWYAVILAALVTGLLTENWPWRLAGRGGAVAAASLVGNLVLGIVIYYIMLGVVRLLVGEGTVAELGAAFPSFSAQLGVCWAFWLILWPNAFQNWPAQGPKPARYLARIVITLVLGVATFLAYYFYVAGAILHEPRVADGLHGNALGWMDWMILWILFYVIQLGSFGLPKPAALAGGGD